MIPRISKGSSAYGALSYDHGKGDETNTKTRTR